MEATQLSLRVSDEEQELMARSPPRWQLMPRTLAGWLVGLTLALCVGGLVAESSVVSNQLRLYRTYTLAQFAATSSPDTKDASSLASPTVDEEQLGGRNDSDAALQKTDAAESSLSPDIQGDETRAPAELVGNETEKEEEQQQQQQPRPSPAVLLLSDYSTVKLDESLPPKVHALWIGDLSRVAQGLEQYGQMGFDLTIHNSVDGILDGFAPHVRSAYELAVPQVVGFDFLKLLLLYKLGGLVVDADTYPVVPASQVTYADECHVLFGKEWHLDPWQFSSPTYRKVGVNTYGLARPYQLLNWAMLAREPRNPHVAVLIDSSMRHFYGLRDMEESLVQDAAGSGLMSDYVALLYAERGLDFVDAFNNPAPAATVPAVDGLCMLENELRGGWIHHNFMNTWRQPDSL